MNETAPGIASAAGRLIITDGANSIVERIPGRTGIDTLETTTSLTFTDLATAGPAVTVTTGTTALAIITSGISNTSADQGGYAGFAVSGATTVAATVVDALFFEAAAANKWQQASWVGLITGLTAGSNTFTMKYRLGTSGTVRFFRRRLTVIPF